MDTRIYTVTEKDTGKKLLVEASHPSAALRLVTERYYTVHVTASVELSLLLEGGMRVIRPDAQPTDEQPQNTQGTSTPV